MKEEKVYNNVQVLRKEMKLTQEAFANELSVTRQTVIAIEKGSYTPSVLLALKIARLCNKPLEEIFTITYEK